MGLLLRIFVDCAQVEQKRFEKIIEIITWGPVASMGPLDLEFEIWFRTLSIIVTYFICMRSIENEIKPYHSFVLCIDLNRSYHLVREPSIYSKCSMSVLKCHPLYAIHKQWFGYQHIIVIKEIQTVSYLDFNKLYQNLELPSDNSAFDMKHEWSHYYNIFSSFNASMFIIIFRCIWNDDVQFENGYLAPSFVLNLWIEKNRFRSFWVLRCIQIILKNLKWRSNEMNICNVHSLFFVRLKCKASICFSKWNS